MNVPALLPGAALAAAAVSLSAVPAAAAPYASGIEAGESAVSFRLNESADRVLVTFDDGASELDLGALPAGVHTFPPGGHASWRIRVEKAAAPGWRDGEVLELGDSGSPLVQFANARGVAVNNNPGSPRFGRVYVSVAAAGTAAAGRSVSDGLYLLNADLTATAAGDGALAGGVDFTASGEAPSRITVGPDDNIYIADWSDSTGSLYVADPEVATIVDALPGPAGGPFPLNPDLDPPEPFRYHGSVAAVVVEGTAATGDRAVYIIDEDLQPDTATDTQNQRNSIWMWFAGSAEFPLGEDVFPEQFNNSGITYASQRADLVRDRQGYFYKVQRRSSNQTQAGIFIVDDTGSPVADSRAAWLEFNFDADPPELFDIFLEAGAVDISDDRWLAVYHYTDATIRLVRIEDVDGLPAFDFSQFVTLDTAATVASIGRDIAFDAAGNLYAVSTGEDLLRVFSPGGTSTAVTGSDGSFAIEFGEPVEPPVDPPVITGVSLEGTTLTVSVRSPVPVSLESTVTLDAGPWTTVAGATLTGAAPDFTLTATVAGNGRLFLRARQQP